MERRGREALAVTRHLQYVKVMTWPPMSCAAPAPPSAAAAAAAAAADAEDELQVLCSRLEYLSHNYNGQFPKTRISEPLLRNTKDVSLTP
jgi:hypothetical protein